MGLRLKLILLFSGLAMLIIIGSFYYLNFYLTDYLINQTVKNFQIIAEISENSYFSFIEKLKIRTVDWTSDGYIKDAVEKIINSSGKERAQLVNELNVYLITEKMIHDPTVLIVDILDKNGVVISSSRSERLGVDEKKEELEIGAIRFSEALKSNFGESFATPMIYEEDEHTEPMIHLTARIFSKTKDAEGKFIPLNAVMLLHFVNTKQLADVLIGKFQLEQGALTGQMFFDAYDSAEIYIVNSKKIMITPSRFDSNSILKIEVDTEPVSSCFGQNKKFYGQYLNYSGYEVIGASMCLENSREILIVEVAKDEILVPLKSLKKRIILGGAVIMFFSFIIIVFLSHFLLKNLANIIQMAKEISKNNFKARVNIKSSDEIGYLGKIFNQMIDNIEKSRKGLEEAEDKLININVDLERRIKERTAELEGLKANLEKIISKRTQEFLSKLEELEKFKKLTINRELKMIELKKEIEELKLKEKVGDDSIDKV